MTGAVQSEHSHIRAEPFFQVAQRKFTGKLDLSGLQLGLQVSRPKYNSWTATYTLRVREK